MPGGPLLILRRPPLKALFLPSWSTYQEAPAAGALLAAGPSCCPPLPLPGALLPPSRGPPGGPCWGYIYAPYLPSQRGL